MPEPSPAAPVAPERVAELSAALNRGEFTARYQTVVEVDTKRPRGVDVLLGWNHRTLGVLPAADFIADLERSGLIVPVARTFLPGVCAPVARLRAQGADQSLAMTWVAGAVELRDPGFLGCVQTALAASRLDPAALIIKVSQRVLADEVACRTLGHARQAGLRVAVQLGGERPHPEEAIASGLCSMVRVNVRVLHDAGLVSELASLERAGTPVLVEAVENEADAEVARHLGAGLAQGYYYSRPVLAADAFDLLRTTFSRSLLGRAPSVRPPH